MAPSHDLARVLLRFGSVARAPGLGFDCAHPCLSLTGHCSELTDWIARAEARDGLPMLIRILRDAPKFYCVMRLDCAASPIPKRTDAGVYKARAAARFPLTSLSHRPLSWAPPIFSIDSGHRWFAEEARDARRRRDARGGGPCSCVVSVAVAEGSLLQDLLCQPVARFLTLFVAEQE